MKLLGHIRFLDLGSFCVVLTPNTGKLTAVSLSPAPTRVINSLGFTIFQLWNRPTVSGAAELLDNYLLITYGFPIFSL